MTEATIILVYFPAGQWVGDDFPAGFDANDELGDLCIAIDDYGLEDPAGYMAYLVPDGDVAKAPDGDVAKALGIIREAAPEDVDYTTLPGLELDEFYGHDWAQEWREATT